MPPRPIYFAIHIEGNSDRHFLPVLIRRTLVNTMRNRERYTCDIQDLTVINDVIDDTGPYKTRLLRAAQAACGYSALIIHRDADGPTRNNAKRKYFDVINRAVCTYADPVCDKLLPVIPIRCIESWMLADPFALQEATGTSVPAPQINLPDQPHQVEAIQDPKQVLQNAVAAAFRHRRRNSIDVPTLYARLANVIDLDRLRNVPSYQYFVSDLEALLVDLDLIHPSGEI